MIAAMYTQGGKLEIGEAPIPHFGDDELLLRVEAASICGTDVKIAANGHRKLKGGQRIILGHEFVGTIEKVGARVKHLAPGMRVGVAPNIGCGRCEMCARGLTNMCPDYGAFGIDRDGGHTEFVRIPAAAIAQGSVIRISEKLSPLDATLAEPLSCALNGVRSARLEAGDVALIYGAGPMGLLNMMVAAACGAARVLVVDLNDARLNKARLLGATATHNPQAGPTPVWVAEQTGGRGVDVVITAVPVPQLQQEAIGLLAPFGRLCLFAGLPNGAAGGVVLDTNAIHYKNLLVTGMTGGSPRDYRDAIKLIDSRKVNVSQIVSDVLPIGALGAAYEIALAGKGMKIVMAADKWVERHRARQKQGALDVLNVRAAELKAAVKSKEVAVP